jgi:heme/copper-type cytochrome/quinol oxidase subunit 2
MPKKKIFSGKERFLKNPDAWKIWLRYYGSLAVILLLLVFLNYQLTHNEISLTEEAEEESIESAEADNKADQDYSNKTAKEVLDSMYEKGIFQKPGETKTFEIFAGSYFFRPNEIKANLNDIIVLKVKAMDADHSIRIPSYSIYKTLPKGEEVTIEFTATKAGEFRIECPESQMMRGKLIIE